MTAQQGISAPTPLRSKLLSALNHHGGGTDVAGSRPIRSSSSAELSKLTHKYSINSRTPDLQKFDTKTKTEDDKLIDERLKAYDLDYPTDYNEYLKNATDESSKWFSRKAQRKLNLVAQMPYETETHNDQARYLSHILVHLYIAIKSLDLEGLVSISTKDLAEVRHDIELTLDTDFFNADLSFDVENIDDEDEGDEEDDEVKSSGVIGKIMPRSATVISVNHWSNELKSCLKMKFDIPLTLRASLAKVYYNLSLTTGQIIQTDLFIHLFVKLTYKHRDLLIGRLFLKHDVLLNYLARFYPDPNSTFDTYSPLTNESDRNRLTEVMRLSLNANYFFHPSAMREVFDWSLQRYSPATAYTSLNILSHTLPISITPESSVISLIPSLFNLWSNNTMNKSWDIFFFDLFGRITFTVYSKKTALVDVPFNDFGIFTDNQTNFIFNKIQENLRFTQKVNSFHGVAKIFTYSITPKNFNIFNEKLINLLNSLETFVHPSNSGPWTTLVARFSHRFIYRYHKRFIDENSGKYESIPEKLKLTRGVNNAIFTNFKDFVLLGSQAKNENAGHYYIAAVGYLADLSTDLTHELINKVLIDLYDSLTDQFINSNHRIIVSLRQFTEIARFIISHKLYRIHITNILSLLINKIGTNDLELTNVLFNALVTVFSFIYIKDLSTEEDLISFESSTLGLIQDHLYFIRDDPSHLFEADGESLEKAFIASTTVFKDLIKSYIEKNILLLEADINDKLLFKFSQTALILVQSLGEEEHKYYHRFLLNKLLNGELNNENENEALFANLLAASVKRDPSLSVDLFNSLDLLIRDEVIHQSAGKTRNNTNRVLGGDKKIVFYLCVLSEILSVSIDKVLVFKDKFIQLIRFLHKEITNPSLNGPVTYILHKTLKNLTNVKLKENSIFQKEPSKRTEAWNLINDETLDSKNLDFDWYVPHNESVSFAIEIFETVVVETLSNLQKSTPSNIKDIESSDEITKDLLYLVHSLSGASILFDPDYNNESFEEDKKGSLEKKLLILKSLRASKSEDSELNIDIEEITKKDESFGYDQTSSRGDFTQDDKEGVDLQSLGNEGNGVNENFEVPSSGISSRVLTPSEPHESDLSSVMNPSIALRESKIYNCNYFFGSTATEKKRYVNYNHIHSLRSLIGQSLHRLVVLITADEKEEKNIKLLQTLLLAIRTFFSDVGKESSFDFDDQIFIDYTFLKKVQSLGNYSKPFTRTALGARIEKFHRQRIILHSTNRFQSKLDKVLLKDVVHLSMSAFSSVHQPAQTVLIESMKKLIGSYSFIIGHVLENMEHYIADKDFNKIEAGLKIFRLKKVSGKLVHDYKNIQKIVDIQGKCLELNHHEISKISQKSFLKLSTSIQVPSAVALFDEEEIDASLRPPDKRIDLEISTVKTAKDIKRKKYISQLDDLQEFLIEKERHHDHWKLSSLYLKFLVELQGYYELPTKIRTLELLAERSRTHHPSLIRLCIKAFSKLVDKIICFASYDHNLVNTFDVNYQRSEVIKIDTTDNFSKKFFDEMHSFGNDASYFLDNKVYTGWLFWGKELEVLDPRGPSWKFTASDKQTFRRLGELLTKNWLNNVLKILAQENETSGVFQAMNVSLIKNTAILLQHGFASNTTYTELIDLIKLNYDKDEKASIIVSAEIICGLLSASKHTSDENLKILNDFLETYFDEVLGGDLSPDSSSVWSVVFWWLPDRVDFRRLPILFKKSRDMNIDLASDLAFVQSARMQFARSYVISVGWRYNDFANFIIDDQKFFVHPYQLVRDQIGSLLSMIPYSFTAQSFDSSTDFIEAQKSNDLGLKAYTYPESFEKFIIKLFIDAESERAKIEGEDLKDALKSNYYYMASTIITWLRHTISSPLSTTITPYIKASISPFLINLENNRELCKLGNLDPSGIYENLARISYRYDELDSIISIISETHSSIHQILLQLGFIEVFFSRQLLQLTSGQKTIILKKVNELLFHSSIEIRNRASKVLSGIIHNSNDLQNVQVFIDDYQRILKKAKAKKLSESPKLTNKVHGSTLGIGALVSAFPYASPPPKWLPEQVVLLAKASSLPGIIGKSAKDILSDFKKLRADTWHIDRHSFTEEQLEDLEGVLWRSYFA